MCHPGLDPEVLAAATTGPRVVATRHDRSGLVSAADEADVEATDVLVGEPG